MAAISLPHLKHDRNAWRPYGLDHPAPHHLRFKDELEEYENTRALYIIRLLASGAADEALQAPPTFQAAVMTRIKSKHQTITSQPHTSAISNWCRPRTLMAVLSILSLIVLAEIGVATKFIWFALGTLGGIAAGSILVAEAVRTKTSIVMKVCLYIAGFLLLYEDAIFIVNAFSRLKN